MPIEMRLERNVRKRKSSLAHKAAEGAGGEGWGQGRRRLQEQEVVSREWEGN